MMTNTERIAILREHWGSDVTDGLLVAMIADKVGEPMTMDEFLSHCTMCGGNWGGMLLTGVQKLWPRVWDAIPEHMGMYAWECICTTITLCGVQSED